MTHQAATDAEALGYALRVARDDLEDMVGALHLLAAAARQRGDCDLRGALRLLARTGEAVIERIGELHGSGTQAEAGGE